MLTWLKSFYSDLHYRRTGFFPKMLLLVLAIVKFVPEMLLFGLISALVSFSSTTYSIAGTMRAKFKEVDQIGGTPAFVVWFWGPLMIVCALLAVSSALLAAVFMMFLSADQCDVVSRVLQKSRLKALAAGVAQYGFQKKNPQGHTASFLLLRALQLRNIPTWRALEILGSITRETRRFSDRKQAARVLKQVAETYEIYGKHDLAVHVLDSARYINLQLGLSDQMLKTSVA